MFFEVSSFAGLFSQFHGLSPFFFLFKMLDGHLMQLISWKNLVLNTLFFLLRPLEYVYPISLIEQKHENISLIDISSEND